jgi:hypothetical protein
MEDITAQYFISSIRYSINLIREDLNRIDSALIGLSKINFLKVSIRIIRSYLLAVIGNFQKLDEDLKKLEVYVVNSLKEKKLRTSDIDIISPILNSLRENEKIVIEKDGSIFVKDYSKENRKDPRYVRNLFLKNTTIITPNRYGEPMVKSKSISNIPSFRGFEKPEQKVKTKKYSSWVPSIEQEYFLGYFQDESRFPIIRYVARNGEKLIKVFIPNEEKYGTDKGLYIVAREFEDKIIPLWLERIDGRITRTVELDDKKKK